MREIRKIDIRLDNSQSPESRLVEGYACVFNSESVDLGGFYEIIDEHALDDVLDKSDVVCLLDHDPQRGILARHRPNSDNNSLSLSIDNHGLKFSFDAPHTSLGDEILEGVKRGDISSCSFAFTVSEDNFTQREDGSVLRTITKIDELFDVSLVVHPAYEGTEVDTRSYDKFMKNNTLSMKKNKRNQEELDKEKMIDDTENQEIKDNKDNQDNQEPQPNDENQEEDEERVDNQEDEENQDEPQTDEEETQTDEEEPQTDDEEDEEPQTDEEPQESQPSDDKKVDKRNLNKKKDKTEKRKHNIMKKFRLIDSINDVINNRDFNDTSKQVIERGRKIASQNGIDFGSSQIVLSNMEKREDTPVTTNGILAGTATYGKEAIPTDTFDIVEALRDKSILAEVGAQFLDCKGNVEIPVYSGSTCTWADEVAEATDGRGTFTTIKLSPKRLTAVLPISRTFLAQTSDSAEAILRQDLINAINEKLQKTIFGSGEGSDIEPAGLFKGVQAGTAAVKYDDVLDIEKEVEEGNYNIDNAKWVVSPSAKALLRNTKIDAGSGRVVFEDNEVLGNPAYSTNSVVAKGLIYGDFGELIVANWGTVDVLVDPYTLASKNQIRLVVHFYVNYALRRDGALVRKVLK